MALAFIPAPTDFTGRWVLERTENLEDFMKHSLGTDHVKHRFPKDMTVVNDIKQEGNTFRLKIISKSGPSESCFEIGGDSWQEQDSSGDSAVVSTKWVGNKLVTTAEGKKTVIITRELRGDYMISTMRCANATARCFFLKDAR